MNWLCIGLNPTRLFLFILNNRRFVTEFRNSPIAETTTCNISFPTIQTRKPNSSLNSLTTLKRFNL